MRKVMTRRSLIDLSLRSIAGAGLLGSMPGSGLLTNAGRGLLAESRGGRRVLVCIYCFGGGDDNVLASPHRLHDSLAALQPLYDRNRLAVITDVSRPARMRSVHGTPGDVMAHTYSALRFLPQGFATLEWAARAAHVDPLTGSGAYTFDTGVSLVAPNAGIDGASFENAGIRRLTHALDSLRTPFPDSTLGRQLEDVSRLIRVGPALGMDDQVFFVGTTGISRNAANAGTIAERHRDLANAMAALHAATVELGLDSSVTTYTDGEFADRRHNRGTRMVLGGSVVGGSACTVAGISQDSYAGAMASWCGIDAARIRDRFPEFEPTAVATMAGHALA
jgi:uncharacterized protein (DUF1501 family)